MLKYSFSKKGTISTYSNFLFYILLMFLVHFFVYTVLHFLVILHQWENRKLSSTFPLLPVGGASGKLRTSINGY